MNCSCRLISPSRAAKRSTQSWYCPIFSMNISRIRRQGCSIRCTGHIVRQCIGNSEIDFRRYDEIFYLTKREDAAETVLLLAMSRLRYPYRLQEKHREVYLDYLREHLLWAAAYFMEQKEGETLRLFADWGLLTAETTPELIALAQKKGQTAVLSFLMDYQHRHFAATKKKKTFDL